MTDIRIKELSSIEGPFWDWILRAAGNLDAREELATAVRVALGTDSLSEEKEILPDPDSVDRRGWWGDMDADLIWGGWPIGTKAWLLSRAKITDATSFEGSTLQRAKQYTLDALQPFIDKRIATRIEVDAKRTETTRIEVHVIIYRGDKKEVDLRYQILWEEPPVSIEDAAIALSKKIRIPYRDLIISSIAPLAIVKYQNVIVPQGNLKLSSVGFAGILRTVIPQTNLALSSSAPFVSTVQTIRQPPAGQLTISSLGRIITPSRRNLVISSVKPNTSITGGGGPSYPAWTYFGDPPPFYQVGNRVTHRSKNWECLNDHFGSLDTEPEVGEFWTIYWIQIA